MNKKIILYFGIIFLTLLPIIYAQSIQDSIQQQIQVNSKNSLINYDQPMTFEEYLAADPGLRQFVAKMMILMIIFSILIIVDMILKGFAMWRAAKKNSMTWFWILLVVSSLGILPLIYLLVTKNPKKEEHNKKKK